MLAAVSLSFTSTLVMFLGSTRLRADTYGVVVDKSLGFQAQFLGLPLVDTMFCIYLVACNVGFLMFLGDYVPEIAALVSGDDNACSRSVAIWSCALIIALFTASNSMRFISYIASCGVLVVLFTATVMVNESWWRIPQQGAAVMKAWQEPISLSWQTLQASGNILFSFCITGNVPPIATDFRLPTVARSAAATGLAHMIMFLFYLILAFAGYFSFITRKPDSDILTYYPQNDIRFVAARTMLCVTLISCSTLSFVPAMKSFYIVLGQVRRVSPDSNDSNEPSAGVRMLSVGVMAGACATVASQASNVGIIISWLGCFFGTLELLAAPLALVLCGHVGSFSRPSRWAIFVITVIIGMFLWTAAVVDVVQG
eukprot:gnl/TRDRNA2_/TRDRNA2_135235_c0_seq1.p1 gnl/TRDRNA2_/TRDRNA2_135235_c0~~gnl/TRDRNA2_/TRDRNA2_135235_c0_seq1.p1  ORF type:complete len:416 (-),score=41.63 gnl/TRDRNA2_/TRDRNA2_135235_c0_seq1:24-1130(-)